MNNKSNSSCFPKVLLYIIIITGCICLLLFILLYLSSTTLSYQHSPTQQYYSPTTTPSGLLIPTEASLLPEFPWPPPKPSAITSLTLGSIRQSTVSELTFRDIDSRITEALATGGYDERSYYGVPNGFAIATRLEQINPEGYPEYSDRWLSELEPINIREFSINDYLNALFGVPQGRYRIFVFIVTSDLVIQSGTPVSKGEAQTWFIEGANKLPTWMEVLPYTTEHTVTAYVYEFVQSGVGENANQNIPSNITGRQHLERAGLWDALEK